MKVSVEKGELVIKLPMNDEKNLPMSKTGKTLSVASSSGNKPTSVTVNGKTVIVGVNAYIQK